MIAPTGLLAALLALEISLVDAYPRAPDFDRPVAMATARPGLAGDLVVEQRGRIWLIERDGDQVKRRQVLDISDRVLSPASRGNNEEGLLGIALDTDLAARPRLYLHYSESLPGKKRQGVIARMAINTKAGAEAIDPASELRILEIAQPAGNHNGGDLAFGPDGMLYIALGDGGGRDDQFGNGQRLQTLLATILRIDVKNSSAEKPYEIPPDNPFVKDAPVASARGEIWAYGLRNPWRISFDRKTGELWCGDVGQDRYEEVDRIVRGGNYGWPLMEGFHAYRGNASKKIMEELELPITEYGRSEGISITGGFVYRGSAIPALVGAYIYADYGSGRIWAVRAAPDNERAKPQLILESQKSIASFAEEANGELLALAFNGRVYRLAPR